MPETAQTSGSVVQTGGVAFANHLPLALIAGPCQLEGRNHALEIAAALKEMAAKLGIGLVFKSSFDKANRTSGRTARGVGLDEALPVFAEIRESLGLPVLTDVHEAEHCARAAQAVDILQIPAFLCRQTDLVVAAARATQAAGGLLHVKKGQFLAPWDSKNILDKIKEATGGAEMTLMCERGVSFGYNNLIVDMLGIGEMQKLGAPVTIDATHAVQLPGADPRTGGASTGGRRDGVSIIAKSAVAAGADGVFLEFHPDPDKALCDPLSCLPLDGARALLTTLKAVRDAVR